MRADCERAAQWLAAQLRELGFEASVRPTAGRPMVVGHAKAARRDAPHVLFYGHYDVQPVDPRVAVEHRSVRAECSIATRRRRRSSARGASDDKGQLMTFVEACRAFRDTGGLPCEVTILFEGEEETGSPSLPAFLDANKAELKADLALVCDTGMWDADDAGHHHHAARPRARGGGGQGREPRPAFGHVSAARPSTRSMCWRASSPTCTTRTAR